MSKSRWKQMTDEQKAKARETEKLARARRKNNRTEKQKQHVSNQRKAARIRRKERQNAAAVDKEYGRTGKGWFYKWAWAIKTRAVANNIPYDIDADYLMSIYTDTCPILGVVFARRNGRGDNSPNSPTVDRIIPAKGYVRGNVMIISRRANNIKSDAAAEEVMKVALFLQKKTG